MAEPEEYRSRAIRALVLLHERELRTCLERWREAKEAGISLPETSDPSYRSLETLLGHLLNASRGYLLWVCEKLELADPGVPQAPPADEIEERAAEYTTTLLHGWRESLRQVPSERLADRSHQASRGPALTILAMLEHAVVHPMRHAFQLEELLAGTIGARRTRGP